MRGSLGNSTVVLRINTANSSLTTGVEKDIGINELARWQPDNVVFQSPTLHIAKPLQIPGYVISVLQVHLTKSRFQINFFIFDNAMMENECSQH